MFSRFVATLVKVSTHAPVDLSTSYNRYETPTDEAGMKQNCLIRGTSTVLHARNLLKMMRRFYGNVNEFCFL